MLVNLDVGIAIGAKRTRRGAVNALEEQNFDFAFVE